MDNAIPMGVRTFDLGRRCTCGAMLVTWLILINACVSSSQMDGLCSTYVSSTVSYTTTYQVQRSLKTYTECGLFGWKRCTRYRTVYATEQRVAFREIYITRFDCCEGWETQADGDCVQITTEKASTESRSTNTSVAPDSNMTNPTSPVKMLSSESVSSSSPAESSSEVPIIEIAQTDDVSSNNSPAFLGDKRVVGGIGGVALALIVLVTLTVFFVSRRRRSRSRKKKRNTEPVVLFQRLVSNSSAQDHAPDVYTEIPGHQTTNADSTGQETVTVQDESNYEITCIPGQRPSGRGNTYQDVKYLVNSCNDSNESKQTVVVGKGRATPTVASLVGKKKGVEVCLGQNGSVYTQLDLKGNDTNEQDTYQNLQGLDDVIPAAPVISGNVGNAQATSYNKLDRSNSNRTVPTDPDDEAYNTLIIGPVGSEDAPYDRLERQTSGPHHGSEDQLDVSIPVTAGNPVSGYSALGVNDANLAYDKLDRREAQSYDPDRKGGKTGPNTYDEISATGSRETYDKLTRQHSADHSLNDSPSKAKSSDELPGSDNAYDTVEIGRPVLHAAEEIYQNLPKTAPENKLKNPSSDLKPKQGSVSDASPVARPLYDIIPGSPRMFNQPVYDILPTSPVENGIAPVYDIPPVSQPMKHKEIVIDPTSPADVGGARPVYDTPPLRFSLTSPLQFEETCPVYENTPTS